MNVFDSAQINTQKAVTQPNKTSKETAPVGIKNAGNSSVEQTDSQPTKETLKELTNSLNKSAASTSKHVKFEYGEDIDGLYINVIDTNTDSLISRFPSEEAVNLAKHMKEIVGVMFDKKI
ncbi:MAG: flagellar protein FlaG [Campylobacterales bacterium]|nr:flagellar protein FlaG [Campylobacterales bacterium]